MANPAASNVVAPKPVSTGGVLHAPIGTALPTDEATAPNAAFTATGYISNDGVTKSESRETNEIPDWTGLVVKRSQSGFGAQFQFQFLEYLNPDAAKAIYGTAAVTTTAATVSAGTKMKVTVTGAEAPHRCWIFDMFDGAAKIRIVVPDGQITDVGDTSFTADDGAVRDVTISAYPDSTGAVFYEYTNDGKTL